MKKDLGKIAVFILAGIAGVALLLLVLYIGFCSLFLLEENTAEVVVDIPGSENQLVMQESLDFKNGNVRFYLRRPRHFFDKYLGSVGTADRFGPISGGDYELTWEENAVVVRYLFNIGKDGRVWREIRLEFPP